MGIHEGEIRRLDAEIRAKEARMRDLIQDEARRAEAEAEKKLRELSKMGRR